MPQTSTYRRMMLSRPLSKLSISLCRVNAVRAVCVVTPPNGRRRDQVLQSLSIEVTRNTSSYAEPVKVVPPRFRWDRSRHLPLQLSFPRSLIALPLRPLGGREEHEPCSRGRGCMVWYQTLLWCHRGAFEIFGVLLLRASQLGLQVSTSTQIFFSRTSKALIEAWLGRLCLHHHIVSYIVDLEAQQWVKSIGGGGEW